jgi:hypothetical protein
MTIQNGKQVEKLKTYETGNSGPRKPCVPVMVSAKKKNNKLYNFSD